MKTGCVVVLFAIALSSCANRAPINDPLTDLRNPKLSVRAREKAMSRAWEQSRTGTIDRTAVREDLKTVAWSRHWELTLRLAALDLLLSDTDPKGREDTRNMVRLMLPRESEPRVTEVLAQAAARNGWQETTPALVRSLSMSWIGLPDRQRPEAEAIATLNPGVPLEQVVYKVFQNPPDDGGAFGLVPREKVRADAWTLLRRLDSDGKLRTSLVAADESGSADIIRKGLRDLRVLPDSGEELTWLTSLQDGATPAKSEWWTQTTAAVARLEPARVGTLHLRHLEPIRWAAVHRTDWFAATREQLLSEADARLKGRRIHTRSAREDGAPKPAPEQLSDWRDKLSWGDLLSILVVDEGLRAKAMASTLFAQATMDREDRTAEYGGLFRVDPTPDAVLFPPRPGARRGDHEFVASTDMIAQSDHAVAHYHFHAQSTRNSAYAGPSFGDLLYAARSGRTCLVFTLTSSGTLNVDIYTGDGVVLDLGEVVKP